MLTMAEEINLERFIKLSLTNVWSFQVQAYIFLPKPKSCMILKKKTLFRVVYDFVKFCWAH